MKGVEVEVGEDDGRIVPRTCGEFSLVQQFSAKIETLGCTRVNGPLRREIQRLSSEIVGDERQRLRRGEAAGVFLELKQAGIDSGDAGLVRLGADAFESGRFDRRLDDVVVGRVQVQPAPGLAYLEDSLRE